MIFIFYQRLNRARLENIIHILEEEGMAELDVHYFEVERATFAYTSYYGIINRINFTLSAIATLTEPGQSYKFEPSFELKYSSLQHALDSIFEGLNEFRFFRGAVIRQDIRIAMERSKCHYLWFC